MDRLFSRIKRFFSQSEEVPPPEPLAEEGGEEADVVPAFVQMVHPRPILKDFTFEKDVIKEKLQFFKIENANGKDKFFKDVNFKYARFEDCYFRNAEFHNCDFTGAKIDNCNFSQASFKDCIFEFTLFFSSILDFKDIKGSLPEKPNLKRDVLRNLRMNAKSQGNYKDSYLIAIEEMNSELKYYSKATFYKKSRKEDKFYAEKYPKPKDRFRNARLGISLWLEKQIWGFGIMPRKFLITILAVLIVFSGLDILVRWDLSWGSLWDSIKGVLSAFASLATKERDALPWWLTISIVIFRYISMGVFVAIILKRISRAS